MAKLLFVCSGNSCRSPMAMIIARNLFHNRHVCDSASGGKKVGKNVSSKAVDTINEMKAMAGTLKGYKPKPLTGDLIDWADHVFYLGESLLELGKKKFEGEPERTKKMKLYDPVNKNVPDPFDGEFFPDSWHGKVTKKTKIAYQSVANLIADVLTPQLAEIYNL